MQAPGVEFLDWTGCDPEERRAIEKVLNLGSARYARQVAQHGGGGGGHHIRRPLPPAPPQPLMRPVLEPPQAPPVPQVSPGQTPFIPNQHLLPTPFGHHIYISTANVNVMPGQQMPPTPQQMPPTPQPQSQPQPQLPPQLQPPQAQPPQAQPPQAQPPQAQVPLLHPLPGAPAAPPQPPPPAASSSVVPALDQHHRLLAPTSSAPPNLGQSSHPVPPAYLAPPFPPSGPAQIPYPIPPHPQASLYNFYGPHAFAAVPVHHPPGGVHQPPVLPHHQAISSTAAPQPQPQPLQVEMHAVKQKVHTPMKHPDPPYREVQQQHQHQHHHQHQHQGPPPQLQATQRHHEYQGEHRQPTSQPNIPVSHHPPLFTPSPSDRHRPDLQQVQDRREEVRQPPVNAEPQVELAPPPPQVPPGVEESPGVVEQEDTKQEGKEELPMEEEIPAEQEGQQLQQEDASSVPVAVPAPPAPQETKPKSWASLFHSPSSASSAASNSSLPHQSQATGVGKPMAKVTPYSQSNDLDVDPQGEAGEGPVAQTSDELALTEFLKTYALNHKAPSLRPRGLSNRSNWCFVNAILQALTACPPFYNFMKTLPLFPFDAGPALGATAEDVVVRGGGEKRWAILRAIWEFFRGVESLGHFPKMNRMKNKKAEDLPLGKTVEATSVFNALLQLNSDNFNVVEGRQEDAEEFLTFLLNGLNDDALAIIKLFDEKKARAGEEGGKEGADDNGEADGGDEDDWKEVGPKRRSCITRRTATSETPLAAIFQGQIRSCVQHSAGQPTATLQPFFTLQLDIQSDNVHSVADALVNNFAVEALDGYVCTKTKQEVAASRSLSLEELPPVLVLHLKRFVYDHGNNGDVSASSSPGGCQKLLKPIDFPVDLEIRRDILSPAATSRYRGHRERQYKLFSVVYHNGKEATKGHYVTDVYHSGLASWLHCDDALVKPISEQAVLSHSPSANSLPYILFYRRGDTMSHGDKGSKGGAGGGGVNASVSTTSS